MTPQSSDGGVSPGDERTLVLLWIGRARHPRPPSLPRHVGVEFLDVGGWLTHGDLALEVGVDFHAVA